MATQMFSILIVLFVLGTGHSTELSGLVLLCSQIPGIIVSPVAGALLDRGAKIPLMTSDYLVGAVSVGLIAVLSLNRILPTPALLVIVSISSLTQPLSRVGGKSLFPSIVPRALWDRSNAVDSSTFVMATVLGPGLAGLCVAVVGPRWALLLPTLFSLLAAVTVARVTVATGESRAESTVLGDAAAAITYVWNNGVLRMLAGTMTVFNVGGGSIAVAIPVVVLHRLHGGSTTVGAMFAVMGFSGFVAGMITGRLGTEHREKHVLAISCGVTALTLVLLGFARSDLLVAVGMAVVGLANGPLTVAMFSLRQRATEPSWFGRGFAVSMNLNFAGFPIGSALAGVLLAHSIGLAFFVAAVFACVGGLWPAVLPASHYEPGNRRGPTASVSGPARPVDIGDVEPTV